MRVSPKTRPDAAQPARTALLTNRRLSPVMSGGALALALTAALLPARPAAAQESFGGNPMQSIMDLFGLSEEQQKPEIDYRERAPLVVPPSGAAGALPSPQNAAHAANPNWPKDPDVARRAQEAAAANKPIIRDDPGRPLLPSELNKGRKKILGVIPTEPVNPTGSTRDELMPSQLGATSWLPNFSGEKEKPLVFNGEPERASLLQPPPGYQTPAPNAPYGVVEKKKEEWKIPSIFDQK